MNIKTAYAELSEVRFLEERLLVLGACVHSLDRANEALELNGALAADV